jgi:hypothetical protein
MGDQLGEVVPLETAQAWDSARRVREPIAWMLLVVAAIAVLVSAWQLFGLPGDGLPGGLGVLSWLGALGAHSRPGVWFILDATDIAAVAAALIFIVAVLRSQASPIRRRRRGY